MAVESRRPLRIAQIAPLYERVPPLLYGGTERVVSHLTEALVARGHDVTLFASGDSLTSARLVAGVPRGLRLDDAVRDPMAVHIAMLMAAYERADTRFDLIHCHTDYLGLPFALRAHVPTVVTLHGRLDIPEVHPVYRGFPNVGFVSISEAQRTPLSGVRWAGTVHHGLPREQYRFHPGPGRHFAFIGRISPEKCPDAAIRVAIRAGIPLKIAAKVDRADRDYFETVIRPLLDHPLVEFLGEVDERGKEELLGDALALLFPVDWPEPFGLVVIEALACGTPVIARRRGSVPELLDHGRTGFVCDNEEEMAAAAGRLGELRRDQCREEFERRFTVDAMTDAYLRLYDAERSRAVRGRSEKIRRVTSPVVEPIAGSA
jgi:glycosyltransferase involved in cell wall biosynthesis